MSTITEVSRELKMAASRWRTGRMAWSFVYHSLQTGAVVFAALTTLVTARGWDSIVPLLFAAVTTVTTGLTAALRPGEKWRSNRLSYSEAERIRLYLTKENASADRALATAVVGDVGIAQLPPLERPGDSHGQTSSI